MLVSSTIIKKVPIVKRVFKTMETKSYPQPGGVHNYFNTLHRLASPVMFSSTVIVSRSRIYDNIGCALELARRGFEVTGVDITPAYIQYAAEQAQKEHLYLLWRCLVPHILRETPCFMRESLATECGSCAII